MGLYTPNPLESKHNQVFFKNFKRAWKHWENWDNWATNIYPSKFEI
jgi:hypothetical protein